MTDEPLTEQACMLESNVNYAIYLTPLTQSVSTVSLSGFSMQL